ncbi:MAG: hypothetical protein IT449_07435 [Phycisphaerales bacterium]|nr:hypothetical protein [Phycisphaerales bacterium]
MSELLLDTAPTSLGFSQSPPGNIHVGPSMTGRSDRDAAHVSEWIAEASRVCRAAAKGDLESRILRIDAEGDLADLLHGINHLLDMTDAFVREATASLEYASQGRFFRRVLLTGMLGTFRRAAKSINDATESMGAQAQRLKEAEAKRSQLETEFQSTLQVVSGLEDASKQIGDVVRVISQVAHRTNLLALNAMIEAARVGEAGRGFTVVANEVKSLAQQTAGATSNIEKQVASIQSVTRDAVQAIDRIWQSVRSTNSTSSQ